MKPKHGSAWLGRPVVLFVDDDPGILSALKRVFKSEPYVLVTTEDPLQAVEWLGSRRIHLLVTDQRMPGLSGIELIKAARVISPATSCVVLTAYPDTAVIVARGSLRIRRLMTKPWEDEELRRVVRDLLQEQAPEDALPPEGAPPSGPTRRITIGCREGDSAEILDRVRRFCRRAEGQEGRAVIVLENLRDLRDSLSRLLKGLTRLVVECDAEITLEDASGCVETFLEALGAIEDPAPTPAAVGDSPMAGKGVSPDGKRPNSG